MDIVYVVREGDNEELRYSLRSLSNLPHNKVFISGYKPDWVRNVTYIHRDQSNQPDLQNSNMNLLAACLQEDLSEEFYLFNDDMYIMEPVDEVPLYHQGPLDDTIQRYKQGNRFLQAYSLIKTKSVRDNPLSFELHIPMPMKRSKVLELYKSYPYPLYTLRIRTLYGNTQLNKGQYTDGKNSTNKEDKFISTGDDFATSPTGQHIRQQFIARSIYE